MKKTNIENTTGKKADWKDHLLSILAVAAVLVLLPKAKEYTSGYVLFLLYAVVGAVAGVVVGALLCAVRKGKLLLCLSAALLAAWFALPAQTPVMSGLLGCAAAALVLSVPALAGVLASIPSGGKELQRER